MDTTSFRISTTSISTTIAATTPIDTTTSILKRLEALEATKDTRAVLCELVRHLNAHLTNEIEQWSASKTKMASDRALLERQVAAIEKSFSEIIH